MTDLIKIYGTVNINGEPCPITNLIDATGEETDDIESATTAVAQAPDGKWVVFEFTATGMWPLQ